ncbi:hypothetical protein KJ365_13600 [Glaciecola sp. XM2]|uniref:hypothetical protein n=1 Tax=Glaciecola sp. XM2 TaxID=1914931 RepID=UPI001BDEF3A2|nr:hypothetical protein [Glaciecola sp. XM2]MBT1451922.1 hypothetical protein [Glaciecola sp. XM2]
MTVKQVVKESGFGYGSAEFQNYMFEHNIELLVEKRLLKKEVKERRQSSKLKFIYD